MSHSDSNIKKDSIPQLSLNCVTLAYHERTLQVVANRIPLGDQVLLVLPGAYVKQEEDLSGIDKKKFIVELMNRNSKLMIDGIKSPPFPEQQLISAYNNRLEEYYNLTDSGSSVGEDHEIRIIVQKDVAADSEDYMNLLDVISTALFRIRDMQSIRLFGEKYDSISPVEQETINELVKLKIYGQQPDKNMGPHS